MNMRAALDKETRRREGGGGVSYRAKLFRSPCLQFEWERVSLPQRSNAAGREHFIS